MNNANINNEECTHTCTPSTDVNATYFVGLISGLLPNRNDGRSSVIVPFRRRNTSVRSNPAGQDYNALLDLNKPTSTSPQSHRVHSVPTCDFQGTI